MRERTGYILTTILLSVIVFFSIFHYRMTGETIGEYAERLQKETAEQMKEEQLTGLIADAAQSSRTVETSWDWSQWSVSPIWFAATIGEQVYQYPEKLSGMTRWFISKPVTVEEDNYDDDILYPGETDYYYVGRRDYDLTRLRVGLCNISHKNCAASDGTVYAIAGSLYVGKNRHGSCFYEDEGLRITLPGNLTWHFTSEDILNVFGEPDKANDDTEVMYRGRKYRADSLPENAELLLYRDAEPLCAYAYFVVDENGLAEFYLSSLPFQKNEETEDTGEEDTDNLQIKNY